MGRQSDAIIRAITFLQSMGDHGAVHATGLTTGLATGMAAGRHTEDYRRRSGKEPASIASQAADLLTPSEQRQHTPPTRPYEGTCSSRFRPATPGLGTGGAATSDHSRQHQTSYAETRLFFDLSRTLPYHQTDLAACGCRRQIASIYELLIDLIDRYLINLPHYGEPCNLAPDTAAAGRKPAGSTNHRLACRHRRNYRTTAAQGALTNMVNKAKPTISKQFSRRGRRPLGRRLSDVRRLNSN